MSYAEVIYCEECNSIFAACIVDSIDKDWLKSKKDYLKKGFKSLVIESKDLNLKTCTCTQEQVNHKNQLKLFVE